MSEFDLPRADILDVIGKGLTEADLIDAHQLGPNARLRRIEREPLLETTWHVLAEAAAEIPDQLAWNFFEQDAAMTYQEALAAVNRLAGGLQAIGIGSGSHVAIMLPNVPAFPIAWLAISRLGAVMVPVNARYTAEELTYVLNDSDSEFLIIDGQFLDVLAKLETTPAALSDANIIVHDGPTDGARRSFEVVVAQGLPDYDPGYPVSAQALLNIQYTSGTTGFPKGCMLRQCYWTATAKVAAERDGIVTKTVLAHQPFFYMDPQWMMLMAFYQRGTVFIANGPSAARFMDWVRRFKVQTCILPEVLYRQPPHPDDANNDLRRAAIYNVRKEVHADMEKRFAVQAREAFGMTEVGSTLFTPIEATDMVGSGTCGIPVAFRETRVVDDDGQDVPQGEIGELVVRGPTILLGYYNKPEATEESFFGEWFRTGDLFRQDERGFHYIVGRKKDMIRRSSENIAAREVEVALMRMTAVEEAAVVAVPDPVRGEEVKAYIILQDGFTLEDAPPEKILKHAEEYLAVFKVPRYVAYRDELPRTPSLKVKKAELKAEAEDLRLGAFDRVDGVWR